MTLRVARSANAGDSTGESTPSNAHNRRGRLSRVERLVGDRTSSPDTAQKHRLSFVQYRGTKLNRRVEPSQELAYFPGRGSAVVRALAGGTAMGVGATAGASGRFVLGIVGYGNSFAGADPVAGRRGTGLPTG